MHSMAVLYLAEINSVRRFDLQMPERLSFSSYTV